MKRYIVNRGKRLTLMILLLLIAGAGVGQGFLEPNILLVYGQVLNKNNGAPIVDRNVFLEADMEYNPNFIYSEKLTTDEKGFFYDTIQTFQYKGGIDVFAFNEQNIITDTIVYFRLNWSENSSIVVNLYIDDSVTSNSFQANFCTSADSTNNNMMKFIFTDNTITTGYDSIHWHWNFGDNNFSTEQNPMHIYTEPGVYKVTLTVTANFSPSGQMIQSSITKIVKATLFEYFSFGGHVFTEYFPIDQGIAYLYKIDEKDPLPLDTFYFDTLGYYFFYSLIEGKYTIKADIAPQSPYYNLFMQTYYGDELFWSQADTVFLFGSNNWECDINLIPANESNSGSGLVSGLIYFTEDENSKAEPAAGIQIYLLDENNVPVYSIHSDENGFFEFINVSDGSYSVFAEIIGKNTIPLPLTINESTQLINTVQLYVGAKDINGSILGVTTSYFEEIEILFTRDFSGNVTGLGLSSPAPGSYRIQIMDITGKPVFDKLTFIDNGTSVDLQDRNRAHGIYLLRIQSGSSQYIQKIKM